MKKRLTLPVLSLALSLMLSTICTASNKDALYNQRASLRRRELALQREKEGLETEIRNLKLSLNSRYDSLDQVCLAIKKTRLAIASIELKLY